MGIRNFYLVTIKSRFGWQKNADWIHTDNTQIDEGNLYKRKQQLVIGLDFGTAFTKVVVGEQRVRYAIPFGQFAHEKILIYYHR